MNKSSRAVTIHTHSSPDVQHHGCQFSSETGFNCTTSRPIRARTWSHVGRKALFSLLLLVRIRCYSLAAMHHPLPVAVTCSAPCTRIPVSLRDHICPARRPGLCLASSKTPTRRHCKVYHSRRGRCAIAASSSARICDSSAQVRPCPRLPGHAEPHPACSCFDGC